MFDWIFHNRELFVKNYVSIGCNFLEAKQLQDEHNNFTMGSNVGMSYIMLVKFHLYEPSLPECICQH